MDQGFGHACIRMYICVYGKYTYVSTLYMLVLARICLYMAIHTQLIGVLCHHPSRGFASFGLHYAETVCSRVPVSHMTLGLYVLELALCDLAGNVPASAHVLDGV